MKPVSKSKGIEDLYRIKRSFADEIRERFEHRAKSCATCETPGACCLDEHFVNVHISRLEADVIVQKIGHFSDEIRTKVSDRIARAIELYDLKADENSFSRTFACPLFEKGFGCLVHGDAKPLPCITHACYERKQDLPPEQMLAEREAKVDQLNERVFGKSEAWLPIPLAIANSTKLA